MGEARKLAQALAAKAPIAVRYIIDAVNKGLQMPLPDAQVFEATLFGLVSTTEDMREGTRPSSKNARRSSRGSSRCATRIPRPLRRRCPEPPGTASR